MSTDSDEIRALVENWAIWRDALDWDRFATVWHDDGVMMATWWQTRSTVSNSCELNRTTFPRAESS